MLWFCWVKDHRSVQVPESRNYMLYFHGFKYQVNKKRTKREKYFMEKYTVTAKIFPFSGAFVPRL